MEQGSTSTSTRNSSLDGLCTHKGQGRLYVREAAKGYTMQLKHARINAITSNNIDVLSAKDCLFVEDGFLKVVPWDSLGSKIVALFWLSIWTSFAFVFFFFFFF